MIILLNGAVHGGYLFRNIPSFFFPENRFNARIKALQDGHYNRSREMFLAVLTCCPYERDAKIAKLLPRFYLDGMRWLLSGGNRN